MKSLLAIAALFFALTVYSQEKYSADTESLDSTIKALYASISGEKSEKRDWARFQNLFVPEARLIPSGKRDGKTGYRILTPSDYVLTSGQRLEENGFVEVEIKRIEEQYGSMVHIWSTYESYHSKNDEKPFSRGINSIQLLHDGTRWWILQIYWLAETEALPIPQTYLSEPR